MKYVGLNGQPVFRSPVSFPYNYDPFVIWMGDYRKDKGKLVYSDKLYFWNEDKFIKAFCQVFDGGPYSFADKAPEKINEFLNLYFDKELKLTAVIQALSLTHKRVHWGFVYEEI